MHRILPDRFWGISLLTEKYILSLCQTLFPRLLFFNNLYKLPITSGWIVLVFLGFCILLWTCGWCPYGVTIVAELYMEAFEASWCPWNPTAKGTMWIIPFWCGLVVCLNYINLSGFFFNGFHNDIHFTYEAEQGGPLPFLDVLVHRKEDGRLGRSVYRKLTHANLYLNNGSHHCSAQKRAVLLTLLRHAKVISDAQHLMDELNFLWRMIRRSGYGIQEIELTTRKS